MGRSVGGRQGSGGNERLTYRSSRSNATPGSDFASLNGRRPRSRRGRRSARPSAWLDVHRKAPSAAAGGLHDTARAAAGERPWAPHAASRILSSMATAERDFYQVLGVERGATDAEIKRAFRKLAQQWHPDVSTDADAPARFKEINEAYQVLSDPERRQRYDMFGRAGVDGADGRRVRGLRRLLATSSTRSSEAPGPGRRGAAARSRVRTCATTCASRSRRRSREPRRRSSSGSPSRARRVTGRARRRGPRRRPVRSATAAARSAACARRCSGRWST